MGRKQRKRAASQRQKQAQTNNAPKDFEKKKRKVGKLTTKANATDTSFRTRGIAIREQAVAVATGEDSGGISYISHSGCSLVSPPFPRNFLFRACAFMGMYRRDVTFCENVSRGSVSGALVVVSDRLY